MISLARCRELLADQAMTDAEVERVRAQLYVLAHVVIELHGPTFPDGAEQGRVPPLQPDPGAKR